VLKLPVRYGAAIILLAVVLCSQKFVSAQIAPTNSATISGSVSDSTGKPVVNAKVSLSGPKNASTQTDAHGLFVFVGVPFGTYQLFAQASTLGTVTRSFSVEGDTNISITYNATIVNGLKVIAQVKNAAPAQFNVMSASITQVNPMAEAFTGETSWRKILEQIPGVAQAGLGRGSDVVAGLPDSPLVPIQISIDGALPYETATLLDDMPLIGNGALGDNLSPAGTGTNISVYPLNGFSSADIVRGPGANAPSIVDSIGGSFVLHSPGIVNQNRYELSVSNDPYGGIVANALAAVRLGKLSAMIVYGVNSSPGPISSAGIPNDPLPVLAVDGESFSAYTPPCSPPSCNYGNTLLNTNYALSSYPFYGELKGLLVGPANQSSAWNQHNGSIALNYMLSPSINIEVFYAASATEQNSTPYYRTDTFLPPIGYTGNLPPGQYALNEGSCGFANFPYRQTSNVLEEKIAVKFGNGVLHLAALQNRTFGREVITPLPSVVTQLWGAGYLNGSTTLTYFNGSTHTINSFYYDYSQSQASNNRDLLLNYTQPLGEKFHIGVSFVKSYYDTPTETTFACPLYGLPQTTSSTPSAISQTTNELRLFVGGNLSEKTSLDLSMYFANADYHVPDPTLLQYNYVTCSYDYTDTPYIDPKYRYAAPRLGFVWRPIASVAVRAAAGGGFAEAPLNYLVGSNGTPLCSGGACTVTLTNVNLQPEKSFGFDLGTDIRLRSNTVLSFDVYRTSLYEQFYNSTSYSNASCPTCGGLPLFVTQYGNLGESRYEGVLLDLRHDAPHGIYWALSGGLTRGYVVSLPAGFYNVAGATCITSTNTNCTNVTVVPGVNFNGTFTNGVSVPYSQALGSLGYRWNAEKYIDLVGTYYGNNNTYFRPAFVELNGEASYPLMKNVALLATFRNITGIYDGVGQVLSPANMIGAPTIAGLPYPLFGEDYGPRTVILTTRLSF